jgi:hypothetical protein
MLAYHDDLQLFNTGFKVGVNRSALRIAELVVYFPSRAFVVDVYTQKSCGFTFKRKNN